MAFSPDGKAVLTGSEDKTARLWDAASGPAHRTTDAHQGSVMAVAFSPDGKAVLTGSADQTARLWDAASGQPIGQPMQHQEQVMAVAFSPDGKAVLTGSSGPDGAALGRRLRAAHRPTDAASREVRAVAFSRSCGIE